MKPNTMPPLKNKYINIYSRFLIILLFTTIGACSTTGAVQQQHREEQIESKLTRGVSTKADVLKVTGKRNGFGTLLMPGSPIIREVWYYEDVKVYSNNMDQKILLIYFKNNIYDGYIWFTNKAEMNIN